MTMTNDQLVQAVNRFAATISQQPLGLAHHCPQEDASSDDPIAVVAAFINQHGGSIRYGWHFQLQSLPQAGEYLIATHYAVWHNPEDGHLVNVTPYPSDESLRPITHQDELLFLVDDEAAPTEDGDEVTMLPRRFFAVSDDASIRQQVEEMAAKESGR